MIAGTGVSVGGMLRTRRRDISIKPNRKLDRKSSRGMIYENEELRLRTIHINAEVEQGQNDKKKLQRENEQLKREIWALRDECDRLEEILKQQNLKSNSDNSDINTDYSEEDESNDETEKEVISVKVSEPDKKDDQKLSADEMHRLRVDFDELSVVDEEDELIKSKGSKEDVTSVNCQQDHRHLLNNDMLQEALNFYSIPYESPSSNLYSSYPSGFPAECPFIFPPPNISYPDKPGEIPMLIPPCPPMYANDTNLTDNLGRPISTIDSHLESTGFPSVSDLDNSSSEASVQTRSTKVISNTNLPKLSPFISGDKASSIPIDVQEGVIKDQDQSANKPKHFFSPLTMKFQLPLKPKTSDEIQTSADSCEKGSADICINEDLSQNRQQTFFSSENLFVNSENEKTNGSNHNSLIKSLSCHDLPKTDNASAESKTKHTKSENALDSSGSFRTTVDITLKPAKTSTTSTTPEIPKLPSFDNKLFTNQYHQHFEQYRNYMQQAMKKPLLVKVPEVPNFCPGFYGFIPIPPKNVSQGQGSNTLEQYQSMLLNGKMKSPKDIQVTSFETPSPQTLQIPPLTPYDLNLLYSKLPGFTSESQGSDVYHKFPLLTKDGTVVCPNSAGLKVQCEACLKKVPAQIQTRLEEGEKEEQKKASKQKAGAETVSSGQKKKERVKKKDNPETPVHSVVKRVVDDKTESRSSSSGGESPRKDHRRMSIYFSPRKRPSMSSTRTSKSLSLDVNNTKSYAGSDTVDSVGTSSDREKTNLNHVHYEKDKSKGKKSSTSSESVPWCACWGNGCI